MRINEYSEKDQVERLSLCKALLHTAAATESLECEVANNSQKSGQLNPANPAERKNSLDRITVTRGLRVARHVAHTVRQGRRTAKPEHPCDEKNETVNSNRRDDTARARQEKNQLYRLVCLP